MEKASFEFGVRSRAYEDRLRQAGHWENFNLMREAAKNDLRTHEADYNAHRNKRIAKREADLIERQRMEREGPQVRGGPVRRPMTEKEIRAAAEFQIDREHKSSSKALFAERHASINGFVRQALRLPKEFEQSRSGWLREV